MKQKKLSSNETLFRIDIWMALHQRLCWLILAAGSIICAFLFWKLLPNPYGTYAMFALLFLLTFIYRWVSGAPYRSLQKWDDRLEGANGDKFQAMLDYVVQLEKALPDAQRRQLNVQTTGIKGALLARLGRKEEALALLRGFDQFWDESQRKGFQRLISKISGENPDAEQKEK